MRLSPSDPEPREGMVTVYDDRNQYLGCMDISTWRRLIVAELASVVPGGAEAMTE